MYLGEVVEQGTATELFERPRHPYTEALLAANPDLDADVDKEIEGLEGTVPDPANPPEGCRFHTRCPVATPICGWEVDDAVTWLSVETNLLDTMTAVERRSNFDATLAFGDDGSAEAVGKAMTGGNMPAAMSAALESVSVDGSKVLLEFLPVPPVELEEVEPGHVTSCVLHTSRRREL